MNYQIEKEIYFQDQDPTVEPCIIKVTTVYSEEERFYKPFRNYKGETEYEKATNYRGCENEYKFEFFELDGNKFEDDRIVTGYQQAMEYINNPMELF